MQTDPFKLPARLFALAVAALLSPGYSHYLLGQQPPETAKATETPVEAQRAATRALETFRKLVTRANYREMGLESPDELSGATLGEPLRVFLVRLDQLREYRAGSDPVRLFNDSHQLIYPVAVGTRTASVIVLEEKSGSWKATSFGNADLGRKIAQARAARAPGMAPTGGTSMIVHVAAFNLYFLAHQIDGRVTLTPLSSHPEYGLREGVAQPAEEVLAALVPFAQRHNGLPM